jgi:hypothetical protein
MNQLIVEESSVISHQHHGFNLLDGLKHNTYYDDQACSSKGDRGIEDTSENERKNADDRQADCADENNVIQDPAQIFACRLSGTDTRDKAAVLLEIVRNFDRVEGDRGIEICEENKKDDVKYKA